VSDHEQKKRKERRVTTVNSPSNRGGDKYVKAEKKNKKEKHRVSFFALPKKKISSVGEAIEKGISICY
jgi:hypothetical protein